MGLEYQRTVQVVGSIPVSPSIILFDDLEGQLNWVGEGSGSDWTVRKYGDVGTCMRGNYGLMLATKYATPTAGDLVRATRRVALREWKVIEVSFYFRHPEAPAAKFINSYSFFYDGTHLYRAGIRWDGANRIWLYWGPAGTFVPFPGGTQDIHNLCWNFAKYTVSFRDKVYKNFQSNDLVLRDLNLPFQVVTTNVPNQLLIMLEVITNANFQQIVYFDDILVQEVA